jgi:hypothetical protein
VEQAVALEPAQVITELIKPVEPFKEMWRMVDDGLMDLCCDPPTEVVGAQFIPQKGWRISTTGFLQPGPSSPYSAHRLRRQTRRRLPQSRPRHPKPTSAFLPPRSSASNLEGFFVYHLRDENLGDNLDLTCGAFGPRRLNGSMTTAEVIAQMIPVGNLPLTLRNSKETLPTDIGRSKCVCIW